MIVIDTFALIAILNHEPERTALYEAIAAADRFLRNHADGIAAMDLFVVSTLSFRLLYGLSTLSHGRRQILWLAATAHPGTEWIARQLTEACGWEWMPEHLIRDRDPVYGEISPVGFVLWAFVTGPLRFARPGKMGMRSG